VFVLRGRLSIIAVGLRTGEFHSAKSFTPGKIGNSYTWIKPLGIVPQSVVLRLVHGARTSLYSSKKCQVSAFYPAKLGLLLGELAVVLGGGRILSFLETEFDWFSYGGCPGNDAPVNRRVYNSPILNEIDGFAHFL